MIPLSYPQQNIENELKLILWVDNGKSFGYFFMGITVLSWGVSTIFIEQGLKDVTPYYFLFFRFSLAILCLTPFMLAFRRKEILELFRNKLVWGIAISESLGLIFQYLAQSLGASAAISTLISLCFLIIVPFLSALMLATKFELYHMLGAIVSLFGVGLIQTGGNLKNLNLHSSSQLSILLLVGSAFAYAFYIVLTSRLTMVEKPDIDVFALFYVVLSIIALLSFIPALVFEPLYLPNARGWGWISALALISTILAFFTYFKALQTIPANEASVLLLLQAVVPFIFEFVVGTANYGLLKWTGISLIFMSMAYVVILSS